MTRREFLKLSAVALPCVVGFDASFIEPTALRVRHFKVNPFGNCRLVHFSDFHFKGDEQYAAEVVGAINKIAPDLPRKR